MFSFNEDYTLIVVASGAAILGLVSGMIGSFAMLKKQSLMADAISHATLPGLAAVFIITGVAHYNIFLLGAAIAGLLAAIQIFYIINNGKIKQDSSISLSLSVYFGFGMVLLSYIQHKPGASQAGIERFLFGQAATMLISDVQTIAIVAVAVVLLLCIFWKELLVVAFDSTYAFSIGLPVMALEFLFATMLVATVVIGLQTVGVVLMSAMIVSPAAAARQWTNNLKTMVILAAVFGSLSGLTGSLASSFFTKLPTGPAIIVVASIITIISLLFAPKRGVLWTHRKRKDAQMAVKSDTILTTLYGLSLQHADKLHGHHLSVVQSLFPLKTNITELLLELRLKGLAVETSADSWSITESGKMYLKQQEGR